MSASSPTTVLIPLADGTEEIEFVSVVGALRRAGITVLTASVGTATKHVNGSRNMPLTAEYVLKDLFQETKEFDAILLND